MAKNKNKKSAEQPRHTGKMGVCAGHYTPTLVNFLGRDIICEAYNSTILAIEDAQKFSDEVRTKGLQFCGLLVALIVGLIAGFCAIETPLARVVMAVICAILVKTLHGLFFGIIYRKENATRGNTQSYLLSQDMIDILSQMGSDERYTFFMASRLKGMEQERLRLDSQTKQMQDCFESETRTMMFLLALILVAALVASFLLSSALPAY